MGILGTGALCAASTTFPEFPRAVQTAANREGRGGRDRAGQSGSGCAALEQGPGLSQGIHVPISLSSSQN